MNTREIYTASSKLAHETLLGALSKDIPLEQAAQHLERLLEVHKSEFPKNQQDLMAAIVTGAAKILRGERNE